MLKTLGYILQYNVECIDRRKHLDTTHWDFLPKFISLHYYYTPESNQICFFTSNLRHLTQSVLCYKF